MYKGLGLFQAGSIPDTSLYSTSQLLLCRLQKGKGIKIATVGGSITAGQGKHEAHR